MPQDRKRVVWFEGMTLDPHHFQQWDRFQQGTINARLRSLEHFDWGVSELEIDRERLANGEMVVTRGTGVLPDGLFFDIPGDDEPPAPRNIKEAFAPTADRLQVFLASPVERPDGGNFLLQGAENRREARYRAESIFVPDENTGADPRQVEVARPSFQIRFDGEPLQAYTSMQIAEVIRSPGGVFTLNDRFVPVCLTVTASERLTALTRRLLELLVTKSATLMDRYRAASQQREVSPADVTALGLLSVVNAYIPLLNHHHARGQSHPEALYLTLLRLAGELTAYVSDVRVHPRDFPVYDHADLTGCFNRIDEILLSMLGEARVQTNYVEIPLTEQRENLYTASIENGLLSGAQFFLIARSDKMDEQQIVRDLPMMLRIASPETIDAVLRSYTRALTFEHTHRLPSALPVDQQANYFQLQKRGPFWEAITKEEGMAVFVPAEFRTINLKLVAVKAP